MTTTDRAAGAVRYPLAAEPLRLAHATLRNRIVMPAHTLLYGEDKILSDRHIAYYRERALGGAGMIITEGGSVHRSARGAFKNSISAIDKRCIPQYERLAGTLHDLDTVALVQLFHIGVHMRGFYDHDNWTPLWGPSRVPSPRDREIPMAMGQREIDELVAGHGEAARNLKLAGIDGVELHAAHSYLLGQFLSPAYNKRTDGYGGSPENRARIVLESARAVREAAGDDFVIALRLSYDEWLGDSGITQEDSDAILDHLAGSGLFDLFDVSSGGYHSMFKALAPMPMPAGYMAPLAQRARAVVGDRAKVMVVGRITDLAGAEQVLADGASDLIGMTRAMLTDPAIVAKSFAGQEADVTRCVGANHCFLAGDLRITCMMNPVAGREARWGAGTLVRVAPGEARHVVVVGGGPAGMKTAGIAAQRGHRVTLLEREQELGGHVALLAKMPTRDGWNRAVDNLRRPLEREGVDVRLGVEADVEAVLALKPDVVVVAAGSSWDGDGFSPLRPERIGIPGFEQEHVIDLGTAAQRALADPAALGKRVLIVDETGMYLPVGLAELLADGGAEVELLSPNATVGFDLERTNDVAYVFPRLVSKGVRLTPQHHVERIDGTTVTVRRQWQTTTEQREADTVVLSVLRTPRDELHHALLAAGVDSRRVGDAIAPRTTAAVLYEGEELGRAL